MNKLTKTSSRHVRRLFGGTLVLAALLGFSAQATYAESGSSGDKRDTVKSPYTVPIYNTCNDELIIINGEQTTTSRFETKSDGSFRWRAIDTMIGSGASDKGAIYKFDDVAESDLKVKAGQGTARSTLTHEIVLKKVSGSKRSGENLIVYATSTTVLDTNTGELVVNRENYGTKCR